MTSNKNQQWREWDSQENWMDNDNPTTYREDHEENPFEDTPPQSMTPSKETTHPPAQATTTPHQTQPKRPIIVYILAGLAILAVAIATGYAAGALLNQPEESPVVIPENVSPGDGAELPPATP